MALKEEDQIKERIRYQTELIKLFTVFLIATGGGVLTLLLGKVDTGPEVLFTSAGMGVVVFCIRAIYTKNVSIRNLINHGKH